METTKIKVLNCIYFKLELYVLRVYNFQFNVI